MNARTREPLTVPQGALKGMTRAQERAFFQSEINRLKADAQVKTDVAAYSVPSLVADPLEVRPAPRFEDISSADLPAYTPPDTELKAMFGTQTEGAARGIYMSALLALGESGATFRTLMLAMGAEMEPRDAIEAMLFTQMANTHVALARASCHAAESKSLETMEGYDRIVNRLGRTFTTQIEALRKYRSGAEQSLRVEHVTVNDGGRAIVGNIGTRRSGRNEI